MTITAGKKRVMLTLDEGVLERLDALCRERGRHRGHVVETILRRSLARLGKAPSKPAPDPRQLDIEDGLPPLPPAGESGPGAGSAEAGEDSRPGNRAETFERD